MNDRGSESAERNNEAVKKAIDIISEQKLKEMNKEDGVLKDIIGKASENPGYMGNDLKDDIKEAVEETVKKEVVKDLIRGHANATEVDLPSAEQRKQANK